MKCPSCNHDLPAEALFCPECGAPIAAAKQDEANEPAATAESAPADNAAEASAAATTAPTTATPANEKPAGTATPEQHASAADTPTNAPAATATVPAAASPSIAERFKALDKKVRLGLVGGVAAVVVVICAVVGMNLFGGVPTDAAKAAFMQSSLATNGAVSSAYTSETPYEVTEFSIDDQSDMLVSAEQQELARTIYGTDQIKTVTCSGKVANESFETTFSALVYLAKIGNDWVSIDGPDIISKDTKPLKGVDTLDKNNADNVSYEDFSSTLDESNGTYTSSASGKQTYSFWFGTDSATAQQDFTFDPSSGWKPAGEAQLADKTTTWNLQGKEFTCSDDGNSGHLDGSITFGAAEGDKASADYNLAYTPSATASNAYLTYKKAAVKGTAAGRINHTFGTGAFDVQLQDSKNSVSLSCTHSESIKARSGNNALYTTMESETVIATSKFGNNSYLTLYSTAFEEKLESNA